MIFSYYDDSDTDFEEFNDILAEEAKEKNGNILSHQHYFFSDFKNDSSNSQSAINQEDPYSKREDWIQKDILGAIEPSSFNDNSNTDDKTLNKKSMPGNTHLKNYILKSELKWLNKSNNPAVNSQITPSTHHLYHYPSVHHSKAQEKPIESNIQENKCDKANGKTELNDCINDQGNNNDNPYNLKLLPEIYSLHSGGRSTNDSNSNSNIDDTVQAIDPSSSTCNTPLNNSLIVWNPRGAVFKRNKATEHKNYDKMSLEEIVHDCDRICTDQQGCRFLQKLIDKYPRIVSELYLAIKDKIVELSCDVFGNYLIQKIIESLSVNELDDLIRGDISTFFKDIVLNQYGTRVIQKLLSKIILSNSLLNTFNILLKPYLIDFAISKNASHILIKYMSLTESPRNYFIINELKNKLIEIANHKYSFYTLQKCIEYSHPIQKKALFYSIAKWSPMLFMDQYGHYVIQFAIMAKDNEINRLIINNYLNDFPKYSCSKYSSTIYEKCIEYFDPDIKKMIIEKLCNQVIVRSLLFNLFGNYVLQKTIQISHEPYRSSYINMVRPLLNQLKDYSFGPKTISNLVTNYPQLVYSNKCGFCQSGCNDVKL